jgi:hypothetical protein
MDASRRLAGWLRLAGALVLALGLSSTAAVASGDRVPVREALAITHFSSSAAPVTTTVLHGGAAVRHVAAKHRLPATATGLAVTALALSGLILVAVRRRRTDPPLRHHALRDGARAPPVLVST